MLSETLLVREPIKYLLWDQKSNHTIVKPNCLNIWHSRTCCINTFLTFWHTSAAAVSYSTTKYILHTEAWRAFLSHYFKYAVPVNCLSNTGVYSSTEEQVNVCCLSRKKAKWRHKNGPTGFISDTLSQFHSYLCFLTKNYFNRNPFEMSVYSKSLITTMPIIKWW